MLQKAIILIKRFEGCHLTAYLCPANVWTIGWGTTKGVKKGMVITQEEADRLLEKDCLMFYNAVRKEVENLCNENQIASLVSFVYNVGIGAFQKSTLLKVIKQNANNQNEITKQFMRWVFAGRKKLKGLERRRKAEVEMYFTKC